MKVYFIYKVDDVLSPSLYAVTNNKDFCNNFISQRSKKLFRPVEKSISSDEYKLFLRDHPRYELAERYYESKGGMISILSTYDEEMRSFIGSDIVLNILSKHTDESALSFSKDVLEALNKLGYFTAMKFSDKYNPLLDSVPDEFPFKSDALGVFVELFGYTLKK